MSSPHPICIRHPKYDGIPPPVLSCKTCCSRFVAAIKERSANDKIDPYKWLADKARAAESDIEKEAAWDTHRAGYLSARDTASVIWRPRK